MSHYQRRSRSERKQEILDAAVDAFLDKGYHNTTMEDIIAKTSLSKGGFYHYYKSTKDIMADLIRQKNHNALSESSELPKCRTKEEIYHTLATIFVNRMFDNSPKQKLHLMMAYEFVYNPDFSKLYQEEEEATLRLLTETIQQIAPEYDIQKNQAKLLLLYRINNTLHFVENLYLSRDDFGLDKDTLYEFYYDMFKNLIP